MKRERLCIGGGVFLVLLAVLLILYNLADSFRAGETAASVSAQLMEARPALAAAVGGDPSDTPIHPKREMPSETVDGSDYIALLEIPACSLSLPVLKVYSLDGLKDSVCRYSGSVYADDMVIAGHNYSSHFGSLSRLQPGDAVTLTDLEGHRFLYTVSLTETILPQDTEAVEEWDLTLFTCTLSGQEQFAVHCTRLQEES